jgi:hypothetical protein
MCQQAVHVLIQAQCCPNCYAYITPKAPLTPDWPRAQLAAIKSRAQPAISYNPHSHMLCMLAAAIYTR